MLQGSEASGDGHERCSRSVQQLPTPDVSPLESPALSPILTKDGISRTSVDGSLDLAPNVEPAEETRNATMVNGASHKESHLSPAISDTGPEEPKENVAKLSLPRRWSDGRPGKALKLSPTELQELASAPESLLIRPATPIPEEDTPFSASLLPRMNNPTSEVADTWRFIQDEDLRGRTRISGTRRFSYSKREDKKASATDSGGNTVSTPLKTARPELPARTVSTPPFIRRKSSGTKGYGILQDTTNQYKASRNIPPPLDPKESRNVNPNGPAHLKPSPLPHDTSSPLTSLPVPPLSLPTYLQLELAAERPSPLYIQQALSSDSTYESSAIKFERLKNFVALPRQLEQILWFGALACLDAWLYSFTILPLRFLNALGILAGWWLKNAWKEGYDLIEFVYLGLGRIRRRQQLSKATAASTQLLKDENHPQSGSSATSPPLQVGDGSGNGNLQSRPGPPTRKPSALKNCRSRSKPSALTASHKADLLKGLLIVLSCLLMMRFDPSRMYHDIRGQAAIKLYVIFNVLEVSDKLLSAMGQDILECLFSSETLERDVDGRSKIIRPFWIFLMALVYNVLHAAALFYQVITLNVAVNSYSNALLTLLTSNQFVEIKGTVFKKFEKENLFQLTCADVVERFQLWLMLLIIAMRNVVEVGGLSISLSSSFASSATSNVGANATGMPSPTSSIIPTSFTVFPKWTGQVLGPFLIVLGSEMVVDWLKHAYINKFNNSKPSIYGRFLDIIAKDYYTHAFADQNLIKRLGLPVFPLACLFIRASIQTYHMFLATHIPTPLPSTATSLSVESANATSTPATKAALAHVDELFRRALGRSTFGAATENGQSSWWQWSLDDVIALTTMLVVFLAAYFLLLAAKLVLGMILLNLAHSRYKGMKEREKASMDLPGKRYGGWGVVEVDDEKRKWIYVDDSEGLKALKDKEIRAKRDGKDLERISRYEMAAKRIW